MASSLASGMLGLVRIKYVNLLFGAGPEQDAYQAAFTLPDLLNYFLIGGAASISLITVLNRYRERGDEEGGDRALAIILCNMLLVLGVGVLAGEIWAPQYIVLMNKGFRGDALRTAMGTGLTRIILPAQLFFFFGSVMSARLQVRKVFIWQAFTPLLYNVCIIGSAVLLHRQLGIYSLAVGVTVGMAAGAAVNLTGAVRAGLRFQSAVSFGHPAFREWLRLSLPLMVGVSLVMFDGIFLKYFASTQEGGITLITNAKNLFNSAFNIIGSAAGAASLPFFTSLYQSDRFADFSAAVGRAVSRLCAASLMISAWMLALAPWLVDLLRGGRLHRADAVAVTTLFEIIAGLLCFWATQGIYARAFYAASDTRTPAITGTLITILSAPLYWFLFNRAGLHGLAIASDVGIVVQTSALAILLHRRRLVNLHDLDFAEIGKAALAALVAGSVAATLVRRVPPVSSHAGDILIVLAGSTVWALLTAVLLHLTRSRFLATVLRRRTP